MPKTYAASYRSVSIPRVLRVLYGLRWGPPHDGQKSVPSELQEARFADQMSRRHFSDFPGYYGHDAKAGNRVFRIDVNIHRSAKEC